MRDPNDAIVMAKAPVARLKRRADFLRAGQGKRWHGKAMSVQATARPSDEANLSRVGFTLTRKVGNAVVRNRARRRLKEALRVSRGLPLQPRHDYVIIGRINAIAMPFCDLQDEIARAIAALNRAGRDGSGGRGRAQFPPRRSSEETRQSP